MKNAKIKISNVAYVLLMLLVFNLMMTPVFAKDTSMQFSVSSVPADNQINKEVSYFDLKVKPNDKQTLTLIVSNNANEEITVEASVVDASTTSFGELDVTSDVERDSSLLVGFTDIAKFEKARYVIPANSEKEIYVKLDIPKEEFDGMILGGFRVLNITEELKMEKAIAEGLEREDGISINNRFQYVISASVQETDKVIKPDFLPQDIHLGMDNYKLSIIVPIQNPRPALVKEAIFNGTITKSGDNSPSFIVESQKIDVAPNSTFTHMFTDKAGYGIDSGKYNFAGSIEYDGEIWNFDEDFTLENEEVDTIAQNAINQQVRSASQTMPPWILLVIAVGVLIIALLIILLFKSKKSNNN